MTRLKESYANWLLRLAARLVKWADRLDDYAWTFKEPVQPFPEFVAELRQSQRANIAESLQTTNFVRIQDLK